MAKPKLYYSLFEQSHEIQVYETRDYQTDLLESLNHIARSFDDDDNDDYYDDEEEDYEEDSDIEKAIEEEEGYIPIFDRNQRWKTKIFREYFSRMMSLAV